jgi:hypothetical protein
MVDHRVTVARPPVAARKDVCFGRPSPTPVARHTGDLYPLTVGAIFLVVFAAMWGGVEYREGDLLPEQSIDPDERQLGEALWEELGGWRADQRLDPFRRVPSVDAAAQTAAVAVAGGSASGAMSETRAPAADPNRGADANRSGDPRCSQLAVRYTVGHPGWRRTAGSDDGRQDPAVADAVATALLAALVTADDDELLRRPGTFRSGIGVATGDETVYVVYRSCAQRRI